MTQRFSIHPKDPQPRTIQHIVDAINFGGIIAYPTDSGYALGCEIGNKEAIDRIRLIRNLGPEHNFSLVCGDLSQIATYAKVNNTVFRLLKAYTPGAYTFILPATKDVPKRLQHPKRKTIGIRVPDNKIVRAILNKLPAPLMSVTLMLPDEDMPMSNADEIFEALKNRVDVVVDGGVCSMEPTTVVDFSSDEHGFPIVLRVGKGDPKPFLASDHPQNGGTFSNIAEELS